MDKLFRPIGSAIRIVSSKSVRLAIVPLTNYADKFGWYVLQTRHESTKKPMENLSPFTMKFFTKEPEQPEEPPSQPQANHDDIIEEIKTVIEEKIRPTIQEDGGDIEFVSYENNIVKVRLQGACVSCPSSTITLKSGVKNMLQYHFEEIEDVEQVFDDDDDDDE